MADSISSLHRRSCDMCGHWYGNPVPGGFGAGLDSPLQDEKGEVQMVIPIQIGKAIEGQIANLETAIRDIERERCAQECDRIAQEYAECDEPYLANMAFQCASAIRALNAAP